MDVSVTGADSAEKQERCLAGNKSSPFISTQRSKADLFNTTLADCVIPKESTSGRRDFLTQRAAHRGTGSHR